MTSFTRRILLLVGRILISIFQSPTVSGLPSSTSTFYSNQHQSPPSTKMASLAKYLFGRQEDNGLDLQRHKCKTCGRGFPFKSHVFRHKIIHNVRRPPRQCSVCKKQFINQDEDVKQTTKETTYGKCCQRELRKYMFQRTLLKYQPIRTRKA